jgi:polysaccharide biosynthesis/export protein
MFPLLFINKLKSILLFFLAISFFQVNSHKISAQKVDDLSDAQVKEFVKRAEASGLSESDMEKYALSRGYSAADVMKLRDRINQLKNPQLKTSESQENSGTTRTNPVKENIKEKESDTKAEKIEEINDKISETESGPSPAIVHVFGSDLFNGKNLSFEPNLRLPTPKNYVLGTDDELLIDIYGNAQMSYKLKISPEGTVKIDNLAPIFVNGQTIDQAAERIINRLKTLYYGLNSQGGGVYAQVTLGNIRSIKVTVVGEVTRPGSYTVSSLSTIFNVLYQAGGPSSNGSYRNITLIRDNKIIRVLDLYDFLLRADQKDNILVRDQDVIRIADYDKRVSLNGEVKRPAIFEVNEGETLKTVLSFAGNFTDKAYTKSIKLTRLTDKQLKIIDIPKEKIAEFVPEGGDIYQIDIILGTFENRVSIDGAVYRPGEFAFGENGVKTVKELIIAAEGLKDDAFTNRAILVREGKNKDLENIRLDIEKIMSGEAEDVALKREDKLKISSYSDLRQEYFVSIYGEVNNPKEKYAFKNNMSIADLIVDAGGFTDGASASKIELARRIRKDTLGTTSWQTVKILEINSYENLIINSNDTKYILQPFDIVTVKLSPHYEVQQNVFVSGEVVYPGKYIVKDRSERISDIIKRVGGLRPSASLKGATILRNKNIVSVDFQNAIDNPNSLDNILILKGDSLNVPRLLETVNIGGAVLNPAIVTYSPSDKISDYISKSGGFTENALHRKVYVTYANGASARTKSFLFFKKNPKVEPGSSIIVPMANPDDKTKLSPMEKASITTAFVSMVGILLTIIRAINGK